MAVPREPVEHHAVASASWTISAMSAPITASWPGSGSAVMVVPPG